MRFNRAIFVAFLAALVGFYSCSTAKSDRGKDISARWVKNTLKKSSALQSGITGLVVSEAGNGKVLCSYNGNQYFVPASNAKILTLYAVLKVMGDSLPLARYTQTDSTLTLWGCANPAFLHPYFTSESVLSQLRRLARGKKVLLSNSHTSLSRFGPGWMWDDYAGYYQPELSSFPLYGNCVFVKKDSTQLRIEPSYLMEGMPVSTDINRIQRQEYSNRFTMPASLDTIVQFRQEIPYFLADSVNLILLSSLLGTPISHSRDTLPDDALTLNSVERDTVCRRMMQVSDNMLADHLLLSCGMALTDSLDLARGIERFQKMYFQHWKEMPSWVDGSGLSRYNLCTPNQLISILDSLYKFVPREKLFSMMAQGGKTGTLKKFYAGEPSPYVFAKTGSMAGVYNLSGYVRAKSGKWLVFSCMSNNFNAPVSQARQDTQTLIEAIRDKY